MSNILVESPFQYLTDRNGRALANGKVYIGQPNQDPQSFPKPAFFDVGGTIPAPQPIRTNSAGFPCDASGNPQRIFTDGDYAIRVSDQNDAQIVYTPSAAQGFFGVVAADLASETDPALGAGLVGYVYQIGAAGQTVHERLTRGWVDVKDFGAVGDGLANDKAAFDAAASTGRTILIPAGTYNVPSGDYSAVRFYTLDGGTTNNSTISIVDPLSNSLPVGVEAPFSCEPGALPFGWLPLNGSLLNRLVYPQLWAFAESSGNIVDEVDKPTNKGSFGRGNGVSTFSLPDKRGTVSGAADDGANVDTSFVLGDLVVKESDTGTATKVNVTVATWAIRAFAQAVNEGAIDIQALSLDVAGLQTDVDALQTGKADKAQGATAWINFNSVPLTGTYTQAGTLITVTMTAHGMAIGQTVTLDFTTGTAVDGSFVVATVPTVDTFTITAAAAPTTSGNVTRGVWIRSAYNIASVTDLGVGNFGLNFTVPMDNTSYVLAGFSIFQTNANAAGGVSYGNDFVPTVNSCTVKSANTTSGAAIDSSFITVVFFGGKS